MIEHDFANTIYFFYISHNFKRCIGIVSLTSFQRRICNVIKRLFLVVWFYKEKIVIHQQKKLTVYE